MRWGQYERVVKYLATASEQGDQVAQTLLGNLYHTGLGVARDYTLATH